MKIKNISVILVALFISSYSFSQVQFPDIEGWNKSDETKVYNTETLWEYINGAADYYLNYGFSKLEVVEYSLSEDEYIKAEVYHHGSELNAFGIYAYERPTMADFFQLGTQGYAQHSALNFYGSRYYVKVHSNQTDERTITTIKKIAEKLAEANISGTEKPRAFGLFPEKNKIENSEKYYPSNYLGYDFFHSALEVAYLNGKDKLKLFVIKGKNTEEIRNMLKEYFAFVNVDSEIEENIVFEVDDTFNDLVILKFKDNILYGVYDADSKKTAKSYLKGF